MPLYEYHCNDCDKEFTLLQPTSVNKEETTCSQCESPNVRHKFSTFSPKISGISKKLKNAGPVTADELPNKDILKLPIPGLR